MRRSIRNKNKISDLSITDQAVLALTANALFDARRPVPAGADWQQVYEECCHQAVPALGLRGAQAAEVPENILKKWRQTVIAAAYNNLRVSWEHNELDRLMKSAKIPYVILKGCASALYYPRPAERVMGDVDFLVKKKDLERAGKVLEQEGFVPWDEEHICHVVYRKPPSHYEMHFEPAGVPYGRAGDLVREYMKDVMDQARDVEYENGTITCPSHFHHGLVILLHTSHHLLGEGIGLRHLCDWAVFAASLSDEEFREIFEEKFRAVGVWKFAGILTRTAERWLGCPHREWPGDQETELEDAIIEDIFDSGNFGRKSEDRSYETYLISSRGKGGVGRTSMLHQMILSLNEIVHTKWPVSKKLWILLPFGWGYYGIRYLVKICRGQRPALHPGKVISGAAKRKEVYKEFGLFERG